MMQMRSGKKQGLTTGEVSRMLGKSILTVERLFKRGILTGYRNPVTGRIAIDLESFRAFAEKSGIELPSKEQMEEDLKAKALKRRWAVIPVTQKEG